MITKEDKILIKNMWESKKYGARRLTSFLTKTGADVAWKTFCANYEQLMF